MAYLPESFEDYQEHIRDSSCSLLLIAIGLPECVSMYQQLSVLGMLDPACIITASNPSFFPDARDLAELKDRLVYEGELATDAKVALFVHGDYAFAAAKPLLDSNALEYCALIGVNRTNVLELHDALNRQHLATNIFISSDMFGSVQWQRARDLAVALNERVYEEGKTLAWWHDHRTEREEGAVRTHLQHALGFLLGKENPEMSSMQIISHDSAGVIEFNQYSQQNPCHLICQIDYGYSHQLCALSPEWSVSDDSLMRIEEDGRVRCLDKGKITIVAAHGDFEVERKAFADPD